jgi:hypothetical protein
MITSLRGGFIVTGCVGLALTASIAVAQPSSSGAGGEKEYAEGSQGVQEKMYEDRMKDFEEAQSQQGMEGQKGTRGQQGMGGSDPSLKGRPHESQQKMQQERMPEQDGSKGQ